MKYKKCRACKKEYLVPSPWPGCCSEKCKKRRRVYLAKTKAISVTRKPRKKDFLDSKEWKELRYVALKRYGAVCMLCGGRPPKAVIHVDHIKPRSKFPELSLDIENLQILCQTCNQGKSNKHQDDFR